MVKKEYIPHAWETVNCPFCNSNKFKIHEKYGSSLQFTYVECSDCKLIYQSPRPKYDNQFINDAYGQYFTYKSDYSYTEKNLKKWDLELHEIFRFDKKRTAILDIGTSMGDFLKVAQKYYNDCTGIEVAENMGKFTAKKLNLKVHIGSYTETDFRKKFSCIHMSHVIEHIPNPKEWIKKTKEILEPDGVLAMSVPHMKSLEKGVKLFLKKMGLRKGKWADNTRTPDHLFEPTIPATIRFFEDNGFEVLEYYSYSKKDMDATTLFGKIYNRWLKLGSNLRFFVKPIQSK